VLSNRKVWVRAFWQPELSGERMDFQCNYKEIIEKLPVKIYTLSRPDGGGFDVP
jgi:hypothetical protein